MFAVSKKIITPVTLIASLLLSGLAQADVLTCFNFLNAQDYARAESLAIQLLQDGNLNRIDERYAQLCLGRAYSSMGRAQESLPVFQRVETLSQTTKELAIAYNWLGVTYSDLNDLDHAELYHQRALKAYRELGNKKMVGTELNNLALVADDRGDQERALQLYRESLIMQPEAEQATTLSNIAMIHSQRKEYKQAIKLLRQAIDIDRRNGDTHTTAIHQINLGTALSKAKQYPTAEKELQAGLSAIRLVGDKRWEAIACENMGWLEAEKDNPKKDIDDARLWLGDAAALYREIGDTANVDRITNLLAGK
jgi:tetratricopeptide (TPR) repeat protein